MISWYNKVNETQNKDNVCIHVDSFNHNKVGRRATVV